jgi:multiple sugar transport system ATP-binding protein
VSEPEEADAEIGSSDSDRLIATVGGMKRFESGQSVTAYVPPDAIHLFDPATSEAIHNRRLEDVNEAPGA